MTGSIRSTLFPTTVLVLVGALLPGCSAFVAAGNVTAAMIKTELYPPAYVNLPFQAGVKGTVLETQFRVLTTASYTFYLKLYFRATDEQDRTRIENLAGDGSRDRNGRSVNTGLPIPVRLSVGRFSDGSGEWSVLSEVFTNHDLGDYNTTYYSKIIDGLRLDPGVYKMRIEALQDIAELNGVQVHFDMHTQHFLR